MSTTIIVDLDSSQLLIPPSINFLRIDYELKKQVLEELSLVLDPELRIADNFLKGDVKLKSSEMLDKQLRAIMLRFMAHLLQVGERHTSMAYKSGSKMFCHFLGLQSLLSPVTHILSSPPCSKDSVNISVCCFRPNWWHIFRGQGNV